MDRIYGSIISYMHHTTTALTMYCFSRWSVFSSYRSVSCQDEDRSRTVGNGGCADLDDFHNGLATNLAELFFFYFLFFFVQTSSV